MDNDSNFKLSKIELVKMLQRFNTKGYTLLQNKSIVEWFFNLVGIEYNGYIDSTHHFNLFSKMILKLNDGSILFDGNNIIILRQITIEDL
jgi:hypothetical protein